MGIGHRHGPVHSFIFFVRRQLVIVRQSIFLILRISKSQVFVQLFLLFLIGVFFILVLIVFRRLIISNYCFPVVRFQFADWFRRHLSLIVCIFCSWPIMSS